MLIFAMSEVILSTFGNLSGNIFVYGLSQASRGLNWTRLQEAGEGDTKEESPEKKHMLCFVDILLTAKDEDGKGMTPLEIRNEADTFLFEGVLCCLYVCMLFCACMCVCVYCVGVGGWVC